MKHLLIQLSVISFFVVSCKTAPPQTEQPKLGLPGDNLNLYAVLKVFQESPTLEGFEKSLNDSSDKINNLDLNGDNQVDYIRVIDSVEENVHNIILRDVLSKDEEQNVAVIVVEKHKDSSVDIQIIGDEDLYGKDYIIEPNYKEAGDAAATPNPGYADGAGYDNEIAIVETTPYEIASWPIVTFIYMPGYLGWYSPWYWGYYPSYWISWTPFFWHYYYGYHYYWNYYYYAHYRRWNIYRTPGWHDRYYSRSDFRPRSNIYRERLARGDYRTTYTRPQLAGNGASSFKRDYPKAPSVNHSLPEFNKTGNPVFNRPARINKSGNQPAGKSGLAKPQSSRQIKPAQKNTKSKDRATKSGAKKPAKPPVKKNRDN